MTSAVPERHPDQDQLADLAAEVLPVEVARSVEAHVMGCTLCERLLADAERVRRLLFSDPPGPMPDDVWLRLENAFAGETIARRLSSGAPPPSTVAPNWFAAPASDPIDLGATRPVRAVPRDPAPSVDHGNGYGAPPPPPPSMSFDEAPTAAWKAFLDDPEPLAAAEPVPLRVGRAVRSGMRSRRDVRSEDKAAVRRPRSLVLAAAAAVVVGVVGLGGGAFVLLRGDDDAVRSGAASLPGTPASIVTASGREYTASTLVAQVRALLGLPSASPGTASSGRSTARPSGSAHPSATTRPAAPTATAGTVADPAQLESCLAGLVGARNRRPLVVDLARWQGRDAAVIVLPGLSGGYDIWVVPRRCSAGSELPIAFKSVPQ